MKARPRLRRHPSARPLRGLRPRCGAIRHIVHLALFSLARLDRRLARHARAAAILKETLAEYDEEAVTLDELADEP